MWQAILEAINKFLGIFEKKTPSFEQGRRIEIEKQKQKEDEKIDQWVDHE